MCRKIVGGGGGGDGKGQGGGPWSHFLSLSTMGGSETFRKIHISKWYNSNTWKNSAHREAFIDCAK